MAPEIGFAERLAYVRWLRARGRISPESDRELATALHVGESWVRKWKTRADAPEGRSEQKALEAALGAVLVAWLYDDEGAPPQPALWAAWRAGWRAESVLPLPVEPDPALDRKLTEEELDSYDRIAGKPSKKAAKPPEKKRRRG